MAIIQKIFAYNTGAPISGTTQYGDLIVGDINVDYGADYGGVKWWGGPNEDLRYVIGGSRPGGQPVPSGVTGTAEVGFWGTPLGDKTDEAFLNLANYVGSLSGQPPFATTNDAVTWLNANGYFTSYTSITPTPTATVAVTPTPTATVTETPTNTPTLTQTPTSTDLSSVTTFTISGCTNLNVLVADLGPSSLAPGDVFNFTFTGGTPNGCYRIVEKTVATPTDGATPLLFYVNCAACEATLVTPTPTTTSTPTPSVTNTQTPSVTPTLTPTPSTSPIPVTGYGFNLVVLPYNFPTSGNTIMTGVPGATSGTTNPNEMTSIGRGIYFNSIDTDGIDRTSYFSQFTGQSITITMSQTGSTAIYSGDTNAFKYWSANTGTPPGVAGDGFVFGTGISVPPITGFTGTTVLIQSATTNWVTGQTVYISAEINVGVTPTPTATSTNTPTPSVTNTQTPSVTPTNTLTPTNTETPTPTPTLTQTPTPTSAATPSGLSVTIVESGGNVVMSASGSLNINDLTSLGTEFYGGGGLGVTTATFLMGTTGVNFAKYSGFTTNPSNFGPGAGGGGATSTSGDVFGVITQGGSSRILSVPSGYTTGTAISSTQTFGGQTFTSLGLTPGTYTYTWGSGANADSINVVVGGAGVTPTPTATSVTPTPTPTSGATGDFTVTVSQQGPDVVWNGSGKFNLAALTFAGPQTIGGGFNAGTAVWAIGQVTGVTSYSGVTTFPTSFGSGGVGVTSNTGSSFGILPDGFGGRSLYVPSGYTSNTVISGSSTYASQTIAGMGLSGGTYTWSWGSGGNASTLVMTITP